MEKNVKLQNVYVLFEISLESNIPILFFKAKLLEQMDEEFGVGNLIDEESEKRKQKVLINRLNSFHFLIYFRDMYQKISLVFVLNIQLKNLKKDNQLF
jgi:hypothetical protein